MDERIIGIVSWGREMKVESFGFVGYLEWLLMLEGFILRSLWFGVILSGLFWIFVVFVIIGCLRKKDIVIVCSFIVEIKFIFVKELEVLYNFYMELRS